MKTLTQHAYTLRDHMRTELTDSTCDNPLKARCFVQRLSDHIMCTLYADFYFTSLQSPKRLDQNTIPPGFQALPLLFCQNGAKMA
jgi:hypothetical protein